MRSRLFAVLASVVILLSGCVINSIPTAEEEAKARWAEAQNRLTLSLQRLQEAYPELRSNRNFEMLQDQLEGTENRLARSRERYNEAVQAYNTRIRTFPDLIGARVIYGSDPMVPFEAAPEAQRAPRV